LAITEVRLPALTEEMSHAVVGTWFVEEGDTVEQGDSLVEMVAETAVFRVPVPAAGTVREILADAGEALEVGSVLAILETEEEVA
jgi:2-oxoglutarate dehydrogenase E2 component (dihydrolipoamide succinyltransferase)